MKNRIIPAWLILLVALLAPSESSRAQQNNGFTYQGKIHPQNGPPPTGNFDFTFSVWDGPGGFQNSVKLGATQTNSPVAVAQGVFTVTLDFGPGVFTGGPRWLEVGMRPENDPNGHEIFAPRHPIKAVPYALYALTPAGPEGPIGPIGPQGPAGLDGMDGQQGPAGEPGTTTADGILSGILSDERLSSNVAFLNGTNVFTGTNYFTGEVTATNVNNIFAGTFTGNVTGNITGTASSATSFTGNLAGDVTGPQSQTAVAMVGGQTAANVATATIAANAASALNFPDTIVKRNSAGYLEANTINALSFTGSGSALLDLNASHLTSGSVADARLSANVALLNGQNLFTGANNFNAGIGVLAGGLSAAGNSVFMNDLGIGGVLGLSGTAGVVRSDSDTLLIWSDATSNALLSGARSVQLHNSHLGVQNTFLGINAGNLTMSGSYNSAIGYDAFHENTQGELNSALGANALHFNLSGSRNTAVGATSLFRNTTGQNNTAVGTLALSENTTANANTAIGSSALGANTTGDNNTAVGHGSLYNNVTGSANSASGSLSLASNTTGYANTASGASSLWKNTVGSFNTASGFGALRENTIGGSNTAVGAGALEQNTVGNYNTAFGVSALQLNAGGDNSAVGVGALQFNESGDYNTAIGSNALRANTEGDFNTASGYLALAANTTGEGNTANGSRTLQANTTGNGNTANGKEALYSNTTGSSNTASGANALNQNTTGAVNTAIGAGALTLNSTGHGNTAMGNSALQYNTTGNFNVALGYRSGENLTTGDNNIDIGHSGVAGEANTIRIGTQGTHTSAFISGINIATVSGGIAVYVDGNGQLGTLTSSRRFKKDIQPMESASEAILKLQPVTFHYNPEIDSKALPQFGLIAEQVNDVDPGLVVRNANGEIQTVRYEAVNAMLLNEFLKDHRKLEEQSATLKSKDAELQAVKQDLAELRKLVETLARQENGGVQ